MLEPCVDICWFILSWLIRWWGLFCRPGLESGILNPLDLSLVTVGQDTVFFPEDAPLYVWYTIFITFKGFPDGLMDDMASKYFQVVLCPTQLFQWKLICTFNQNCPTYYISNRLQFNSSLFFWKIFETVLHRQNFFQGVPRVQKMFKYIKTDIYLLWAIIEDKLVIV